MSNNTSVWSGFASRSRCKLHQGRSLAFHCARSWLAKLACVGVEGPSYLAWPGVFHCTPSSDLDSWRWRPHASLMRLKNTAEYANLFPVGRKADSRKKLSSKNRPVLRPRLFRS